VKDVQFLGQEYHLTHYLHTGP